MIHRIVIRLGAVAVVALVIALTLNELGVWVWL